MKAPTALVMMLALGLCAWSVHLAFSAPAAGSVAGLYRLDHPWTLRNADIPQRIELATDGTLRVLDAEGAVRAEGRWWWDERNGWVRSDAPGMDRRIRGHVSWTGTTLLYRIQEPLNSVEEVVLHRAS